MISFVDQLNNTSESRSRSRNNILKTSFGQKQPNVLIATKANASNKIIPYSKISGEVSMLDDTIRQDFQQDSKVEGQYTPKRHYGVTPLQHSFRIGAREDSIQRQKEMSISTRNKRDRSSSQNSTLSRNNDLNIINFKNGKTSQPSIHNFSSPQRMISSNLNNQSIRQPTLREDIPAINLSTSHQNVPHNNSSIISIQAKRRFEQPKTAPPIYQEEQSFSRIISHQDSQYIDLDFNKPQKRTSFGDSHLEISEPKVNLDNILELAVNEQKRLDDSLSVISQQDDLRNRVQNSLKLNHANRLIQGSNNSEKNLPFLTKDQKIGNSNPMLNSTFSDNPDEISLPFLFFDVLKGYFQNLCYSIRRVLLTAGNKIDQQRNLMALEDTIDGDEMAHNEITSNIRQNDILNIVVFLLICILVLSLYNKY